MFKRNLFLFVIFLIPVISLTMERQETVISVPSNSTIDSGYSGTVVLGHRPVNSSNDVSDSSDSVIQDESDLCDFAMARYGSIRRHVEPHLKMMLRDTDNSPLTMECHSHAETLRRIRSGETVESVDNHQVINDIVMKAMIMAFDEKEKELAARERRIKEKYSGKKTAAIAAITATVATIVSTICTTIITMKTSK